MSEDLVKNLNQFLDSIENATIGSSCSQSMEIRWTPVPTIMERRRNSAIGDKAVRALLKQENRPTIHCGKMVFGR